MKPDCSLTELSALSVKAGQPHAFTQACDEDSVFPIRHFYQRWGAAIAIERRPSAASRLHAAERALADPDPAVRETAEIVQAAYREVAGGGLALETRHR